MLGGSVLERAPATTLFAQIRTRRDAPSPQCSVALCAALHGRDQPLRRRRYHEQSMSPQISIDRDAVSAFCRRHHITRLALFGSVLRDDFGPESDIDVLVEFQAGHVPGLKFVSIERELSGLLHGRRVDMVTSKFLNPRIRDEVLDSAEPLYVAA